MHFSLSIIARFALLMVVLLPVACGSSDGTAEDPGPYKITFSLDASFQAVHGGQPVSIAVVRATDGKKVAEGSGTVSATQDPSFTFTADNVMERGLRYEVHYWIDSNLGGGTSGVCDSPSIDHQWSFEILTATNDVNWTTSYEPTLTEDVCSTFI